MENLNFLPILVAALIPMIMGFIWYHPKVLGNPWMKSIGKTEAELQRDFNMPVILGISFVMALMLALGLHMLVEVGHSTCVTGEVKSTSTHTFGHGAFHGVFYSLFVVIPVFVTNGLFERRSWTNILINIGYWTLTMALMSGLMDAWS